MLWLCGICCDLSTFFNRLWEAKKSVKQIFNECKWVSRNWCGGSFAESIQKHYMLRYVHDSKNMCVVEEHSLEIKWLSSFRKVICLFGECKPVVPVQDFQYPFSACNQGYYTTTTCRGAKTTYAQHLAALRERNNLCEGHALVQDHCPRCNVHGPCIWRYHCIDQCQVQTEVAIYTR